MGAEKTQGRYEAVFGKRVTLRESVRGGRHVATLMLKCRYDQYVQLAV